MTIKSGDLKHRILIERETQTSDGQGGFSSSWGTHGEAWAKATTGSAASRLYRGEMQHTNTMVFTIRKNQIFTLDTRDSEKYRIVHQGKVFSVSSVSDVDYAHDYLDIGCTLFGGVAT